MGIGKQSIKPYREFYCLVCSQRFGIDFLIDDGHDVCRSCREQRKQHGHPEIPEDWRRKYEDYQESQ